MQFDLTQDFPVGLDRLWAALGHADYIEQKYRSLGSTSLRIRGLDAGAESIEIELDRQAPVALDDLPLWARVFSGTWQAMRQHTRWRRVGRDRVDAELDVRELGRRVGAKGTGSVVELSPAQSRMTLHFHVASRSRALPSRVADVFVRQLKHALQADHEFTLEYLRASAHRR
jgi:hypothetical protein